MKTWFAEVILPLPLAKTFTYRLPQNMEPYLREGMRVVVPFGKQKLLTGIIASLHETPPTAYQARYIDSLLDADPVVNEAQLAFWQWIAKYYMCMPGEVLLAALPGGLRLSSETRYQLNPAFDGDLSTFTEREALLLQAIATREVLSTEEISEVLGIKSIQPTLKKLLDAAAIMALEDLKEKYKPRMAAYVRLSPACSDEEGLQSAFKMLARAPKQTDVLMMYVQLSKRYTDEPEEVKKGTLIKYSGSGHDVVASLVKKGVFELYEREEGRLPMATEPGGILPDLSEAQQNAIQELRVCMDRKAVTLLHGVTSSGKTELFAKTIQDALKRGKQVLYMLPEIALTSQMIQRLQRFFGPQVVVYHSRFNQNERVEAWNLVLRKEQGSGRLVLGARSAMWLPFSDLGLIIVDEEHDPSYKQSDPAPRYHARDAAIVLGAMHKAPVVLGSATPAFETMHNALKGKFGYVQLSERFGGMQLPKVELQLLSKATAPSGYFTEALLHAIREALADKEQVILFQNRRGYAPVLVCNACGWSPECTRCDVSTTYHKSLERLVCHYCGSRYSIPPSCGACGSHQLKLAGFGTERIEEELEIHFPQAGIARLDLDSTRTKTAYQQILGDFQDGAIDILVGTQMVTKGLDFGRVSLVGVLNADLLLKYPEYRSVERAFQLMTQVAGRAGRRKKQGRVIIQARDPGQWVLSAVSRYDYDTVYQREMEERQRFRYPPFIRIIQLTFRHAKSELLDLCCHQYKVSLATLLPDSCILGPEYPHVARVKNRYNKHMMLKLEPGVHLVHFKEQLDLLNNRFFAQADFRSVRLIINVDP